MKPAQFHPCARACFQLIDQQLPRPAFRQSHFKYQNMHTTPTLLSSTSVASAPQPARSQEPLPFDTMSSFRRSRESFSHF